MVPMVPMEVLTREELCVPSGHDDNPKTPWRGGASKNLPESVPIRRPKGLLLSCCAT